MISAKINFPKIQPYFQSLNRSNIASIILHIVFQYLQFLFLQFQIHHYIVKHYNFKLKLMKSNIKPSQKGHTLKQDFRQFFIQQSGKSVVQQSNFQEISDQQQTNEVQQPQFQQDNDFKQQDQEEVQQKGIKTSQFWSQIKTVTNAPKKSSQKVYWNISCPLSFGFNSLGRDSIILIQQEICKAAGCMIIFNKKIYQKHYQKISTLCFNKQTFQLLSATEGIKPQLFLWKYSAKTKQLQFLKRFCIGKRCQSIYGVSFFKDDYIVAVQKFTLQKSSVLHLFNKNNSPKVESIKIKVKKFYDMETIQKLQNSNDQFERLYFANDEGIFELKMVEDQQNKQKVSAQLIVQTNTVTCLCPFYLNQDQQVQILYGDKDGNISGVYSKKSFKVHEGWIFEIKNNLVNGVNHFFCLGALDCQLSVIKYQKGKIQIIRKLSLGGYGRSIYSENNSLLIGKRDGSYQHFLIDQLIKKTQDNIKREETVSLKCFQSRQKGRKFFLQTKSTLKTKKQQQKIIKSYLYGNEYSKTLQFFKIQNGNLIIFLDYQLRAYPKTLDSYENLIAYTYDVESKSQQSFNSVGQTTAIPSNLKSMGSTFLNKNKKQKCFDKSVLIIEDYISKKLYYRISLKVQQLSNDKQSSTALVSSRYSAIKFSPSGKYLALGNHQGQMYMLRVDINKNNQSLKNVQTIDQFTLLIKASQTKHKQPIASIIWSIDQKYFKTISYSEMYHWKVEQNEGKYQLKDKSNTNKKTQNKLILKNIKSGQLKDIKWHQISKFSWETKPIWETVSNVSDIQKFFELEHVITQTISSNSKKQISSQKLKIILSVLSEGQLKIYNYPPDPKKYEQLVLNYQGFQICPYVHTNNGFSFWVLIQGVLVLVQLSK